MNSRVGQDVLAANRENAKTVDANGIAGRSHYRGVLHTFGPPDEEQVQACIEFFKRCEPTKRANFHSYGLKHVIEKWSKTYVSNGACIEAAKRLGLTLMASDHSLNCIIGVSCRSLRKLEREAEETNPLARAF